MDTSITAHWSARVIFALKRHIHVEGCAQFSDSLALLVPEHCLIVAVVANLPVPVVAAVEASLQAVQGVDAGRCQ